MSSWYLVCPLLDHESMCSPVPHCSTPGTMYNEQDYTVHVSLMMGAPQCLHSYWCLWHPDPLLHCIFLCWLIVIAKRKVTCPYNLTPAIGLKSYLSFLKEDKWRWYWAGMWGRWYYIQVLGPKCKFLASESNIMVRNLLLRVVSFDKYSWMSLTRLDTLVTYQDQPNAIQSWPSIKKGHFPERQ